MSLNYGYNKYLKFLGSENTPQWYNEGIPSEAEVMGFQLKLVNRKQLQNYL